MPTPSNRSFSERVAVVSDGANVFGRAIALQLALQGCYVVVGFADSAEENKRAIRELQEIGTLSNAIEADVSTVAGVQHLFAQVEKMYGRLDLLVNTAQFETDTDFLAVAENEFAELVNRNLRTTFFCSQAAVKLMGNRPNAAIVNLADESENSPNVVFAAAQTALIGLTKSLAKNLAPKIRVNCVSFTSKISPPTNSGELLLLRPATVVAPNDVAQTAVYLLSPEAAAITGQNISVGQKRSKI